jgi:putative flippase GtrA
MRHIILYGIVGLILNFALYCIYLLLCYFIDPKLSMTLVYGVGVIIGYFSHKKITFDHEGDYVKTLYRFGIAHVTGYLINLITLYFFVNLAGYRHEAVQAISILVIAIYLFFVFKFWVFSGIRRHASN